MRAVIMHAEQLEAFAVFLEEHPGFSPLLTGGDALVCGFQVGGCFLRIDEMERLIATRPRFNPRQAAPLLSVPAWSKREQR
jgi:hypothetical protein